MRAGRNYHALVLCWRAGQRSPIHDHKGSSCGVKVLQGTCTETLFDFTDQRYLIPTETRDLHEGHVCGSFDTDIHQVSNLQQAGSDLVTLHIYFPPLLKMGMYTLTSTEVTRFEDPVFEFTGGAGI